MNTELIEISKRIRCSVVEMCYISGASHVGTSLSCVDILTALFFYKMKLLTDNDDIFVLSKGHASAAYYATLAHRGYFPVEDLQKHGSNGSKFYTMSVHQSFTPIYGSTGTLGHGLPIAVGIALGEKLKGMDKTVFSLLGDGECQEGSIWEAASIASHLKLNNLTVIVDQNGWQAVDKVNVTQSMDMLSKRWESFGWLVVEVDGHNIEELKKVFDSFVYKGEKPVCIIAKTIKGKGVSFMEDNNLWHYRNPSKEQYIQAVKEINGFEL